MKRSSDTTPQTDEKLLGLWLVVTEVKVLSPTVKAGNYELTCVMGDGAQKQSHI